MIFGDLLAALGDCRAGLAAMDLKTTAFGTSAGGRGWTGLVGDLSSDVKSITSLVELLVRTLALGLDAADLSDLPTASLLSLLTDCFALLTVPVTETVFVLLLISVLLAVLALVLRVLLSLAILGIIVVPEFLA